MQSNLHCIQAKVHKAHNLSSATIIIIYLFFIYVFICIYAFLIGENRGNRVVLKR